MHEKLQNWINWDVYRELMNAETNAPHVVLGLHDCGEGQVILAYRPEAQKITVVSGKYQDEMEVIDDKGFFGVYVDSKKYDNDYILRIQYNENNIVETEDAYSFDPQITAEDRYLFAEGNHYQIYEKLGAHPMTINGVKGTYFAVWAPHARRVSVVGDFNLWDGRLHQMRTLEVSGIYEIFIPRVDSGAIYKFQIMTRDGKILHKCDPYAASGELRPNNASVVADISNYKWTDSKWMKKRSSFDRVKNIHEPISIYEAHIGSWRKTDADEDGFYNYRQAAKELADYLVEMGYTHVELMGISEHPFDGSWGYQVTGYYAPTSRYGTPEDFMYFVNYLHSKGIGVILDWVPAHFPKDAHGLARFDGFPLYEHPDARRGEHPHWGTYIFNYEKREVENFLVANALYWIEKFHVDGLRVDAVASMLYLDYGKDNGNWLPNDNGGRENLDAIRIFRHLNRIMEERNPGVLMIAEESTAWAGVTAPASMDGLGFGFKWDMGWMNDFLEYMKCVSYGRKHNHNKLTFSMMYAYTENFIQALSHDEVVHGKCTLLNKMPGERDEKFANLRVAYAFMYGHPGKKLLFMGQEFAQEREWSEARELDWNLLEDPKHKGMQELIKTLNNIYRNYPAMYINDGDSMGFEWMSCDDKERSNVTFVRRGNTAKKQLLFVCNFNNMDIQDFRVGVPSEGKYKLLLNSDDTVYGGEGRTIPKEIKAEAIPSDGKEYSITFRLAPFAAVVFEFDYKEKKEKKVAAVKEKSTTTKSTAAKSTTSKSTTAKTTKAKSTATKSAAGKGTETKSTPKKNTAGKSTTTKNSAVKSTAASKTDTSKIEDAVMEAQTTPPTTVPSSAITAKAVTKTKSVGTVAKTTTAKSAGTKKATKK